MRGFSSVADPGAGVDAAPRRAAVGTGTEMRERWRMGPEAKALVFITAVVLAFGLAVLYSASAIVAMNENRSSAYFLIRQLEGVAVGIAAFAVAAKMDAQKWEQWAWPLMWLTIVAMTLALFSPRVHGSRRFLFGQSLQPSELGKFAVIVWVAMLTVKKGDQLRHLTKGVLPFLLVIGGLDVLAVLEPDLSVAMLYTLLMAVILYAGGARIGHFVALGVVATPLLWTRVEKLQYAVLRLTSFFDPGSAPATVSYQLQQSLVAVGSGRLFGVGFGQGRQQYGFLPFPYSDFIASNIGEEWGFLGLAAVTLAFAAFGLLGFRIARQARSPFLQLVAVGLTFVTVLTALLHVGVVVGLLPTTGLTLPFVSYGRSNLVLTLFTTGVLVNIGSTKERVYGANATNPLGG
ncbi:MAG TPA: putative peptidoglycan glycosyltransferase FtsW [Gemmatimonadaceae bacterium]